LMIFVAMLALTMRRGFRFFSGNEKAKEVGGTILNKAIKKFLG